MERSAIEERVKDVMAGLFDLEIDDIGAESSIETIENWDSLQHVNLVVALEQEFGVALDVEDALEMTTFPAVCETVERYLSA